MKLQVTIALLLFSFVFAEEPDGVETLDSSTNEDNITEDDRDSKTLFIGFVKPKPNPLFHGFHHLLHSLKPNHRPAYNPVGPCGRPHCPGSGQPSAPSPSSTRPPVTLTVKPVNVENCTCIAIPLCPTEDQVNQGEGVINPRAICQENLVCCLTVPIIPVEIARLQWGRTGYVFSKS